MSNISHINNNTELAPIKGLALVFMTFAVSCGIFMNVLDSSIANVAIPSIAGNLAISANQGTWIITSFTVSMAIVLPLTGWLGRRFGEVRLFVFSTFLFTIASILCGLSYNLQMMIAARVMQGAVAGPMIPLSQSLLLANYPPEKKGLAMALWATIAVAAPVLGPILGGYITDNYTWPWIFYINVPVGILSVYLTWMILKKRETPIIRAPIDYIGLALLILGVGCLQILLDQGQDLDWFNSNIIILLSVIAAISLSYLLVWELTEKHPIIDLFLFKKRNFTVGTIAISLGYGTYFGGVVILPLWLQTEMNYTPTWAGIATAPLGILPVIISPFLAFFMKKIDLRLLSALGFAIFAYCSFWVGSFNTDISVGVVALARFIQGLGAPFFFIPTLSILLSQLPNKDLASAAGLSNFCRILAGSFGTSISVSLWDTRERLHQSNIVQNLTDYNPDLQSALHYFQNQGFDALASHAKITLLAINQAYMQATNDIFILSGYLFAAMMIFIWFARPPFLSNAVGAVGH